MRGLWSVRKSLSAEPDSCNDRGIYHLSGMYESGSGSCEDCVNNCPNGAIYMEDKHAVIDHELCENCNVCQYVCSRRIIKEMEVPEYTYLQREALGIRKGE